MLPRVAGALPRPICASEAALWLRISEVTMVYWGDEATQELPRVPQVKDEERSLHEATSKGSHFTTHVASADGHLVPLFQVTRLLVGKKKGGGPFQGCFEEHSQPLTDKVTQLQLDSSWTSPWEVTNTYLSSVFLEACLFQRNFCPMEKPHPIPSKFSPIELLLSPRIGMR